LRSLTSISDRVHTVLRQLMMMIQIYRLKDQTRYTCGNMVEQQTRKFSTTYVHHEWKYRRNFFFLGGGTFWLTLYNQKSTQYISLL